MNYQFTLLCIIFLTFSSCGYEQIPALTSPTKGDTVAGSYFQFNMVTENIDPDLSTKFLGFEIYYRFFSPSDPTLGNNQEYSTIEQLADNKFIRATFYKSKTECDTLSNQDLPLVKIPAIYKGLPSPSLFRVDFQPLNLASPEEPYIFTFTDPEVIDPQYTVLDATISRQKLTIRRGVADTDNPSIYKAFNKASASDTDLKGITSGSDVAIVLYAVSYGKYQLSTTIFSNTICLLSITISLPWE
jgi:hypothetical protein